jgi:hypothetical protein
MLLPSAIAVLLVQLAGTQGYAKRRPSTCHSTAFARFGANDGLILAYCELRPTPQVALTVPQKPPFRPVGGRRAEIYRSRNGGRKQGQ